VPSCKTDFFALGIYGLTIGLFELRQVFDSRLDARRVLITLSTLGYSITLAAGSAAALTVLLFYSGLKRSAVLMSIALPQRAKLVSVGALISVALLTVPMIPVLTPRLLERLL
jgi:hypothetical protein